MSARSPWLHAGARVVLVGIAASGVVLGVSRVGADPGDPVVAAAAPTMAADLTTSYCPGDPFAGGGKDLPRVDITGATQALAAPPEVLKDVVTASDEPGEITLEELTDTSRAAVDEKPSSGPLSESRGELGERPIRVRGTQERAPGLLATQSFTSTRGDVRGLAALPCATPTADAWLVAGGGEAGHQERLVLTNPGGNAVTARLTAVGDTDRNAATRSVVVPAHSRSVVLLDAIGGTQAPQAVHVTTTGGLVVPTMVDNHLDGLTPAGVETIGQTAAPATRLVLPGTASGSGQGIVVAAPGDRDAVVQVRRLGTGPARSAQVVTVPAGQVVDVDLPKAQGLHGLLVESDEPVVAAARVATTDKAGRSDLAWSVATPSIGTLGGVVLPTAPAKGVRRSVEVAAADGPATGDVLVLRDGRISTESFDLEQGRSLVTEVDGASAVWVRPASGRVHAAALLIGRDGDSRAQATSIPVLPTRVSVRDVSVTQVR